MHIIQDNSTGKERLAKEEIPLVVEEFLNEHYLFRRNVLNGKVEYAKKPYEGGEATFIELTQWSLNSMSLLAKREGIFGTSNPKSEISEYVFSDEVPTYNPIAEYLEHLPRWDGTNHVARLFSRLPGISTEQTAFLTIWLRSVVAHWLQMDTLHGNECVPTLIGKQGCGKTTFLRRLLPAHLRDYYLDHLNLSNKFDKEMALTNYLLVNIDELDVIRPGQHAALKQTLSKNQVNGRPIFGHTQENRPRFASFAATTNNPHPLNDVTGSRRFICLSIPKGEYIDRDGDIDYEQLYAQVLYEIRELKAPYWFNNDEVERIQQLNLRYMCETDIASMVSTCFRLPKEGERAQIMSTIQLLDIIRNEFPTVKNDAKTRIHLGKAMKEQGYKRTEWSHVAHYTVMPLKKL